MSAQNITVPPPLSATDKSSFAYKTIKERLPVILVKTIDFLHRKRKELHKFGGTDLEEPTEGQLLEMEADAKATISRLTKVRKDVETNKAAELFQRVELEPNLEFFNDDIDAWNKCLEEHRLENGSLPRYFLSPWLLVECYMYRRLKDLFLATKHLKRFDPFVEQKQAALRAAHPQMVVIAEHLLDVHKQTEASSKDVHPSERSEFNFFARLCLWANKSDLSISGMSADKIESQALNSLAELRDSLDELQPNILCDNLSEFWFRIQSIKALIRGSSDTNEQYYLDLVADNSGYELFVDLCLLHMLCLIIVGTKDVGMLKIRIHLKRIPWFVSDTLRQDVDWLFDYLGEPDREAPLQAIGKKLRSHFNSGLWELCDDKFWTLPHDYSHMNSVATDLYSELGKSSLIIFKGDLNYRKLVGDRKWHILTPMRVALRGFGPAPLVALRTNKADVVVGIEDVNIFSKINNNELPSDWMISGNYGLVQFVDTI